MRNLIITVIFIFLGVANAAKDDLKFVTDSADIKPIVCNTESKPQEESPFLTEKICAEVEKEKCGGKVCSNSAEKRDLIIKRMSSDQGKDSLSVKVHIYTQEKFEELKRKYKLKCGNDFANAKLELTDEISPDNKSLIMGDGIGGPEYNKLRNKVKIPRWKLFDSTAQQIDELLMEQLGSACLFDRSANEFPSLSRIDNDINLTRWHKKKRPIEDKKNLEQLSNIELINCKIGLEKVEKRLATIETEDQRKCREGIFKNLKNVERNCFEKYVASKKAFANLMFLNERKQVSHWTRACSSPSGTEQLDMECYLKRPNSKFKSAICDPEAAKNSTGAGGQK